MPRPRRPSSSTLTSPTIPWTSTSRSSSTTRLGLASFSHNLGYLVCCVAAPPMTRRDRIDRRDADKTGQLHKKQRDVGSSYIRCLSQAFPRAHACATFTKTEAAAPQIRRRARSLHRLTLLRDILARLFSYPVVVLLAVVHEELEGLVLCRRVGVRVVEQVLHAEQHLLNRDGRPPVLVLVQDAKTHRPAGIDVRVEQGRHEADLGRPRRVIFRELHGHGIEAAFPVCVLRARDPTLPFHEVVRPVLGLLRPRMEALEKEE
mmetsp:Transcript_44575/g.139786  ORF Transcript_44575/g.139786 Transcript_44575/m.139786 type:complete len:261 (-) Transcript_44575:47-829(-)